jgi:uncharacterized protein YjeT (DUF2065 family)
MRSAADAVPLFRGLGKESPMAWLLMAIGLLWVVLGSLLILYTAAVREALLGGLARWDRRLMALAAGIVGVLLLAASGPARQTEFVLVLGLIAVAKGLFIYVNPRGAYERLIAWYRGAADEQALRFIGILALVLGTALFSWA